MRAAYLQPRSGLDGLGRYLAKMDPGVGLDAHSLRHTGQVRTTGLAKIPLFLATLAHQLEQDIVKARRDAMHHNTSAAARAALQQEGRSTTGRCIARRRNAGPASSSPIPAA